MTIPNGTRVTVETDLGAEPGVVLGATRPVGGERVVYTIRFDDRTQSPWPDHLVAAETLPLPVDWVV